VWPLAESLPSSDRGLTKCWSDFSCFVGGFGVGFPPAEMSVTARCVGRAYFFSDRSILTMHAVPIFLKGISSYGAICADPLNSLLGFGDVGFPFSSQSQEPLGRDILSRLLGTP